MKNPATRARSGSSVTIVPSSSGRSRRVHPANWATIMTEVRIAVASRPNNAQPAQSIALRSHELMGLDVKRAQHVGERLVEAGDTLIFEAEADVVHVDADDGEPADG